MKLCECGCGIEVSKEGNKYINGHNGKGKTKENDEGYRKVSEKLSGRTKESHEYIKVRSEKLTGRTKETHEYIRTVIEKRSEKMRGRTKETHEGVRRAAEKGAEKRRGRTKETYEYLREAAKKHSRYMKNGGAVYANSFNTNPSGPQVEIYKTAKEMFPELTVKINYPFLNYGLDIAILEYKVAIEYDGSYWHGVNKKKGYDDDKRQKECENYGWKFLRYEDKIPTMDQLKEDIQKLVQG